ncbi:MAG: hypothetical protein WAV76_01830 [Bacteroidota bacterium]
MTDVKEDKRSGNINFVSDKVIFPRILDLVLFLFFAAYVFITIDLYYATESTLELNSFFMSPIRPWFFSIFDLITLVMCWIAIRHFCVGFTYCNHIAKLYFLLVIICTALNIANPNNHTQITILGVQPFADMSLYPYIFFTYILFSMEQTDYIKIIKRLFYFLTAWIICRSCILILEWTMGFGNTAFFGTSSPLIEADSLFVVGFVAYVCIILFLIQGYRKYLWISILPIMLLMFSFRRSSLLTLLFALVVWGVVSVVFGIRKIKLGRTIVQITIGLLAGMFIIIIFSDINTLERYVYRYFGLFFNLGGDTYSSDSGHFASSILTSLYAIARGGFWGFGYGSNPVVQIPGAAYGIIVHNVYAATWLFRGFYMVVLYLFIFVMLLYSFFQLIAKRKMLDKRYIQFKLALVIYMLIMMLGWFASPLHMAESLKMRIFWTAILSALINVTPRNFYQLLPAKSIGVASSISEHAY